MDAESSNRRRIKKRKLSSPLKCSICLELIEYTKDLTFITCGHYYHDECINKWLEKKVTCPICRIPIFIQDFEQLDKYRKYLSDQKINEDLRRRNIPMDDNSIALMFLRDRHLFPKAILELAENNCYSHLLEIPEEPSFEELYGDGFDSDEDETMLARPPAPPPLPNLLTYYPTEITNILNSSNAISNIVRTYNNPLDGNRQTFDPFTPNEATPLINRPIQILRRNAITNTTNVNESNNVSEIRRRILRRTDSHASSLNTSSYNTLFNSRTILDSTSIINNSVNVTSSQSSYTSSTSQSLIIRLPMEYPNSSASDSSNSNTGSSNIDEDEDSISEQESEVDGFEQDEFEKYARYEHLYQTYDELENIEEQDDYRDYDDYRVYQDNLRSQDEESVYNSVSEEVNETRDVNNQDEDEENIDQNRLFPQQY